MSQLGQILTLFPDINTGVITRVSPTCKSNHLPLFKDNMKNLRNLVKDEIGATSVEWVVLTAMIISVAFVILSSIGKGVDTAATEMTEDISAVSTLFSPEIISRDTKIIVTQNTNITPSFIIYVPAQPYTHVSYLAEAEVCENPVFQYHDLIDTPLRQCLLLVDVIASAKSLRHFPIRPSKALANVACEKPVDQFYHQPETYCLSPDGVFTALQALPPVQPYVFVAMETTAQCKNTAYQYYRQSDTAQNPCRLSPDVIVSVSRAEEFTQFAIAKAPEISIPKDCSNSSCMYFRKSDAKPLHSYFSQAPAFFAPAQCENPPCLYSHQSELPLPPSLSSPNVLASNPPEPPLQHLH